MTAGHRAVVEEKPEVRKAGGIFYTPTFIVEAIVRQTLGKLLAGKTPAEVGAPLRIADIACVARHDRMVSLVERRLDLHKRLAAEQTPHVKTVLQRHAKGGGDGSADRPVGV